MSAFQHSVCVWVKLRTVTLMVLAVGLPNGVGGEGFGHCAHTSISLGWL